MSCWNLEDWNVFKTVDEAHNEICALDFSHDGRIFATAGKVRKKIKSHVHKMNHECNIGKVFIT